MATSNQPVATSNQPLATSNQPFATDGWTLVTRRRRPSHFLPSPQPPPKHTTALNPRSPTYAQIVRSRPGSPPTNADRVSTQDKSNVYVRSPHSPTNLRYPPNSHFKEWWGRCFRCAQKGHIAAECKMPRTQQMTHPGLTLLTTKAQPISTPMPHLFIPLHNMTRLQLRGPGQNLHLRNFWRNLNPKGNRSCQPSDLPRPSVTSTEMNSTFGSLRKCYLALSFNLRTTLRRNFLWIRWHRS